MALELPHLTSEDYIISANVDWLTVTSRSDRIGMSWQERFMKIVKEDRMSGGIGPDKKWKALGYEGKSANGIRWGYSDKLGWIVILSGHISSKHWRGFVGNAVKATRIDLAVTVALGVEMLDLPRKYYEEIESQGQRKRTYSLVQNTNQGQTLYVGSRQSDRFGRVYDKGVESKTAPPGMKWRYEAEFKKPVSEQVKKALLCTREKSVGKIVGTVYDFFAYRLVKPLFSRSSDGIRIASETRVTTVQKRLTWLSTQVRPTVQQLILAGYTGEMVEALGLEDLTEKGS